MRFLQHSSLPAVCSPHSSQNPIKNQFISEYGSTSKPYHDFSHIQNKSKLLIEAPKNPQVLAPLHFPPICHSASHRDHRDGKIKDTELHVPPDPLSQGKMSSTHRKKSRKENICNGGSLWVMGLGRVLFYLFWIF